jgi:hypothetical protein
MPNEPELIDLFSEDKTYKEPCAYARTAKLDDPIPQRDWEYPDNRGLPLWEQELHRTNGGNSRTVAWLSLFYGGDGTRESHDDNAPFRFIVVFSDRLARKQGNGPIGSWEHDITDSFLGQDIIKAWIAMNPEKHASLPKTYGEWYQQERRSWLEDMAVSLQAAGIATDGLSEDELITAHRRLAIRHSRRDWLKRGFTSEQVEEMLRKDYRSHYVGPDDDAA